MNNSLPLHAQFLSHFKGGMMRPNRYKVEFVLPKGLPGSVYVPSDPSSTNSAMSTMQQRYNGQKGIDIKCHTATFPQRSLQTYEHQQNSAPFRVPYSALYDPVTFSFYSDSSGDTRRYFEAWQGSVINHSTNTLNFYDEFTANVKMYTLNDRNEPTYGIQLIQAYPMSVGAVEVAYSQIDNYQTIVCTLAYRRWERIL